MAVAHSHGRFVPLTPTRFPICGSREEVLSRVRVRCGADPEFRRRWAGWWIYPVRFDDGVKVAAEKSEMRGFL